jgi:ABC-type sugar transport system ATPase subunit
MDTGKSDAVPLPAQLPLIAATGLGMTFPGVRALEGIAISIPAGEVHAIVGENGAGKSTLIRILSGEIADYDGELRLDGSHVRFTSPRDAIARGIAVIPQELLLVGPLTASENICLGHEPQTARRCWHRSAKRRWRREPSSASIPVSARSSPLHGRCRSTRG